MQISSDKKTVSFTLVSTDGGGPSVTMTALVQPNTDPALLKQIDDKVAELFETNMMVKVAEEGKRVFRKLEDIE